jgi:hypothetical protein
MPPDPTALLEAAKREAHEYIADVFVGDIHANASKAYTDACTCDPCVLHRSLDRALRIAERVGEIRAYTKAASHFDLTAPLDGCCGQEMCYCDGVNTRAADVLRKERDRLLAELEGM